MTAISENSPAFPPTKSFIKIIQMGGEISKLPEQISCMLNGLKFYSLELKLNEERYYIQAFEKEAIELYNTAIAIFHAKSDMIKKPK